MRRKDKAKSKELEEAIKESKESKESPPIPPTRRDREIALKELELDAITKFMGGKHQNTHISRDERLLLAILYHDLAKNPWAVSKQICLKEGITFDDSEFEIDFLKYFIDDYLDFGLPLERLGRNEVKDIFKAYFSGEEQDKTKKDEKLIS